MHEYRAQFRGTPSSVRDARLAILDYARLCGFAGEDIFDIVLGAGEALANAVEHGNKDLGFFTVTCSFADGELTIEVADTGPGFEFALVEAKNRDPSAIRGFGITIMRATMNAVDYTARGTTVRLRKRRRNANAAQSPAEREEA
jgi:anti-sigma regulatory factor (Ser/Thr protein kinase)